MSERVKRFLSRIKRETEPSRTKAIVRAENGIQPIKSGEIIPQDHLQSISMARLPEEFLEKNTLSQLSVGESAYSVPWAMAVTENRLCVLNGRYTFHKEPFGTSKMLVRRGKDGYEVYVPEGYKYSFSRSIPWVGAAKEDFIPVTKVHKGDLTF